MAERNVDESGRIASRGTDCLSSSGWMLIAPPGGYCWYFTPATLAAGLGSSNHLTTQGSDPWCISLIGLP